MNRGDRREAIFTDEHDRQMFLDTEHLGARPTGHLEKIRSGVRLRRETTMILAWVAERLHVGAPSHVAHLLCHRKREHLEHGNSQNTLF
jgi:hypothetical protein